MSHRHTRAAFVVALALAPAIAACGTDTVTFPSSTTSATSTGVSGATSSGSGAGGSTDTTGSGGGSGGASTSGTGGASGRRLATVNIVSGPESAAMLHSFSAKAGFSFAPDGSDAVYTASTVGACEIRLFTMSTIQGTQSKVDAGVITITGGKVPVTLTPDAMSTYPGVTDPANDLFDGGDTLTIKAAGGTVPAFKADVITSVGVDITLPVEPANKGPLPVDRTSDLLVTWNNGGPGDVFMFFNDGLGTRVFCTFSSAAGKGTVPKAALGALSPNAKGSFGVGAATLKTVTAGAWSIPILVTSASTWNGAYNPQTFTFQASN